MGVKKDEPVTTEEFQAAVEELVEEASTDELMAIPGLYEVVSEHYNNEAIERALAKRAEKRR